MRDLSSIPVTTPTLRVTILMALLVGCDTTHNEASREAPVSPAPAIVVGADGVGLDLADNRCAVVLRQVARVPDGRGGFETVCDSAAGPCRWRWFGTLDVSGPGIPHVLYRTTETAGTWHAVAATPTDTAGRFTFELADYTPRPDYSGTALSRFTLELIPYLLTVDGGRLFDHNRIADPFANYLLELGNGFAIDDSCISAAASGPVVPPGPDAVTVDWAGAWVIYRGRPNDNISISEPLDYRGFTNMGLALQVSVYAEGKTTGGAVDTSKIKVFLESDLVTCDPGGAVTLTEVPLAVSGAGPYGNDGVYRFPFESALSRCPRGDYRFRMLISGDGGLSALPLGLADNVGDPGVETFRTLRYQ
jgi:hypothetical protein